MLIGRVLQLIFARNLKVVGSNQNDCAFLRSRDMFSEGECNRICGEDYQLVQIDILCCRPEHQQYLSLPAATTGELGCWSQDLFICFGLMVRIKSLFSLTKDRQCNVRCFGMFRSADR